ncbi:hypothetical protein F2Q70_00028356 [Brassica cretica]|uniref:Uncharacterized protein n=1 Tax=Brassica cretica TaxID=69181 RepID=A0A8S9LDL5_BRACR|nr:hypothetical protein F2Q70_00028356 [Brassica cretica]KAF3576415.1 hypothetical protein DY000_02035258 [Brassica cretica]
MRDLTNHCGDMITMTSSQASQLLRPGTFCASRRLTLPVTGLCGFLREFLDNPLWYGWLFKIDYPLELE